MLPQTQIARLAAPIVLAHGLFGFNRIGIAGLTISAYFRGIPGCSRNAGNRVLVTRVPAIAGTEYRARRLGRADRRGYPNEPVDVIGHSMGGLDGATAFGRPSMAKTRAEPDDSRHAAPGNGIGRLCQAESGSRFPADGSALGVDPQGCLVLRAGPRAVPPQDGGSGERAVLLRGGRPRERDRVLAVAAHFCRASGSWKGRTMVWFGRVRTRVRHAFCRRGRSITLDRLTGSPAVKPIRRSRRRSSITDA